MWLIRIALGLVFLLPVAFLVILSMGASASFIDHVLVHLLPQLAINSLLSAVFVTGLSLGLGAYFAFITTLYAIPGRKFVELALCLPMMLPPYIYAYLFIPFFGSTLGWPGFRSLPGLIFCLILAFTPYAFILIRSFLMKNALHWYAVAISHGVSMTSFLRQVLIPSLRIPATAAAILLLLETLAEFGASSMFSVPTLSSGIYKTWVSLFSLESAAFLGLLFFAFVLPFVVAEFFVRRSRPKPVGFESLGLRWQPVFWLHLGLPLLVYLLLAVVIPLLLLLKIVWFHAAASFLANVWVYTWNTALIGVAVASLVSGLSLAMAALLRWRNADKDVRFVDFCVSLGYGMPGILIGIGVFGLVSKGATVLSFDQSAGSLWPKVWALGGVLFGLAVRFAAPSWKLMERTLLQLPKQLDHAAVVHGRSCLFLVRKLYIPFLTPSLWFGFALVLVEVMKELPVTLLLRPVGFDTLAVKVFEFTSEGEWEKAATPILLISVLSILGFSLKWFFDRAKSSGKGEQ